MKHVRMAVVALAACCAGAALPAGASSWYGSDWLTVVNQSSISLQQAVTQAGAATGGRAIEAEFKRSKWGNAPGWEVELLTADGMKTEVWVDAQTGQVSQQRSKHAKYKYTDRLNAASLSMEQALEAAVARAQGRAISADLDTRQNTVVYEVKLVRADGALQKLFINAQDGSVQPLVPATAISLQQAVGLALQTAPGRAVEADLDTDGAKYSLPPFYEVTVLTHNGMKTELRVDAQSGQTSVHKNKPVKQKDQARLNAATLTLEQAVDAALGHTGGARVLEVDLESKMGKIGYEVKVLRDDDVLQYLLIDARDGSVVPAN